MSGESFTNPEVLADFTTRSIHIAATVGKRLTEAYYTQKAGHAYFLGCSAGGRQGIYAAIHHPDDFNGILAGAPTTNMISILGWVGMMARYLGAPNPEESASYIPSELWQTINAEVLRQCDAMDGVIDGIITEPDACQFRPEELLCKYGWTSSLSKDCLSREQVETLKKVYGPLYGSDGEFVAPGFTPGAELSPFARVTVLSGRLNPFNTVCFYVLI